MNPKDIMTDAIHNFHPQYQQYTQYSSGEPSNILHRDQCHSLKLVVTLYFVTRKINQFYWSHTKRGLQKHFEVILFSHFAEGLMKQSASRI